MADSDKKLGIGISITKEGDGGAQASAELKEVAQSAEETKEKLEAINETPIAPEADSSGIEETVEAVEALEESVDSVSETVIEPEVEPAAIEEAVEVTEELGDAIDEVNTATIEPEVDSGPIETATEAVEDLGDAVEDADGAAAPNKIEKWLGEQIAKLPIVRKLFGGQAAAAKAAAVAVQLFNAALRANPIIAVAGALTAGAAALLLWKTRTDDAADSQDKLKKSAKELEQEELALAESVGYVAENQKQAKAATEAHKLAIDQYRDALSQTNEQNAVSLNSIKSLANEQIRAADAVQKRALAEIQLKELNGELSAMDAAKARASLEAANSEEKFRIEQDARAEQIERLRKAERDFYEMRAEQLKRVAEAEQALTDYRGTDEAVSGLRAAYSELQSLQRKMNEIRDDFSKGFLSGLSFSNAEKDLKKQINDAQTKFDAFTARTKAERESPKSEPANNLNLERDKQKALDDEEKRVRSTAANQRIPLEKELAAQNKLREIERESEQAQENVTVAQAKQKDDAKATAEAKEKERKEVEKINQQMELLRSQQAAVLAEAKQKGNSADQLRSLERRQLVDRQKLDQQLADMQGNGPTQKDVAANELREFDAGLAKKNLSRPVGGTPEANRKLREQLGGRSVTREGVTYDQYDNPVRTEADLAKSLERTGRKPDGSLAESPFGGGLSPKQTPKNWEDTPSGKHGKDLASAADQTAAGAEETAKAASSLIAAAEQFKKVPGIMGSFFSVVSAQGRKIDQLAAKVGSLEGNK